MPILPDVLKHTPQLGAFAEDARDVVEGLDSHDLPWANSAAPKDHRPEDLRSPRLIVWAPNGQLQLSLERLSGGRGGTVILRAIGELGEDGHSSQDLLKLPT